MLPTPASADWRMSASPIGRSPDAAIRRTASAESKPSASTSGPRRRSDWWRASCRAERSSTTGALKHTATASSVASTARARRAGFFHRSPGPYRCHDPVIRMCVRSARPSSKRTSRFFPRASTASTMRPERSAPSSRGSGDAKEVIRFPCSVRPRARAARRIVSPSGIGFDLDRDRARDGTFEVAAAARLESRFAEEAGERGPSGLLAVHARDEEDVATSARDERPESARDRRERFAPLRFRLGKEREDVPVRRGRATRRGGRRAG